MGIGGFLAVVEGISRIAIKSYTGNKSFLEANIEVLPSASLPSPDLLPSLQAISTSLLSTLSTSSPLPPLLARRLGAVVGGISISSAPAVVDILAASIPVASGLTFEDKLAILEAHDPTERVERAIEILNRVEEGLRLKKRIGDRVDASVSRRQREYLLMQQLKAISDELKDLSKDDPPSTVSNGGRKALAEPEEEEEDDLQELERKIKAKVFSPESKKVALREMKRLKSMPPHGAEFGVIRRLNFILSCGAVANSFYLQVITWTLFCRFLGPKPLPCQSLETLLTPPESSWTKTTTASIKSRSVFSNGSPFSASSKNAGMKKILPTFSPPPLPPLPPRSCSAIQLLPPPPRTTPLRSVHPSPNLSTKAPFSSSVVHREQERRASPKAWPTRWGASFTESRSVAYEMRRKFEGTGERTLVPCLEVWPRPSKLLESTTPSSFCEFLLLWMDDFLC